MAPCSTRLRELFMPWYPRSERQAPLQGAHYFPTFSMLQVSFLRSSFHQNRFHRYTYRYFR